MIEKIKRWFRKPSKINTTTEKSTFTFQVEQSSRTGDLYTYNVEAKSAEEAASILVNYFYRNPDQDRSNIDVSVLTSNHQNMHWPSFDRCEFRKNDIFSVAEGLAFARIISGEGTKADYDLMEKKYWKLDK